MDLYTSIDNAMVSYKVDGSGPSNLVLVHGAGANAETNWGHLVKYLAHSYKVVRPNFSGAGDTRDDGLPLTTAQLAEQVIAAAKAANAIPFDLVGFSLGTSVSTYIAAKHPEYVKSLVLVAPYLKGNARTKFEFNLWKELISSNIKTMSNLIIQTGFSTKFTSTWDEKTLADAIESNITTINWDGFHRQAELLIKTDVTELAKKISKPTLIIGCTYDYMIPPIFAIEAAKIIPHSQHTELDSGHMVIYEKTDELINLIVPFIQGKHASLDFI